MRLRGIVRTVLFGGLALVGAGFLACVGGLAWFALTTDPPAPLPRTTVSDAALPAREVNGIRLHLEVHGPTGAPVVIVLHGGPGLDYRYLLPLRALADDYQVVFYDQRGSGLSPRVPKAELTLEQFVAELDAIGCMTSPDAPFRLIGHSWGAMLGAAYLRDHGERVLQAVFAEPGFLTPELGDRFLAELDRRSAPNVAALTAALRTASAALRLSVPEGDEDARLDFFFTEMSRFDGEAPLSGYFCGRQLSRGKTESWRLGARALETLLERAVDDDGRVTLDLSPGPRTFPREVLLVTGSCNEIIGPAVQAEHQRLFRKARLTVMQGAGHTMFGERPDESLRLIRDYFAAAPAAAGTADGAAVPAAAGIPDAKRPCSRR